MELLKTKLSNKQKKKLLEDIIKLFKHNDIVEWQFNRPPVDDLEISTNKYANTVDCIKPGPFIYINIKLNVKDTNSIVVRKNERNRSPSIKSTSKSRN